MLISINLFLIWMNTQTTSSSIAPPQSYRQLIDDLKSMTEEQKVEYIQNRFDMISGITKIDNIVKEYQYNPEYAQKMMDGEYREVFNKYGEIYKKKTYIKYTDSLYTEYYFLQKIDNEIEQSAGYDNFLEEIQKKATQLSQISIFNKEGSYDSLNIKVTAKVYKDIAGIKTEYFPQEGIVKAISFKYSDVVLIFIMILLASFIVREEKDNGLLTLIRTNSAGKTKTAIAKLFAMGASLLVAVTAIYVVNLFFCNYTYELGSLTRSIQSIPYLMRSTMRINFIEYFVIFIFTKWVAAFICGVWILFSMLVTKRVFTGYALSLSIPILQLIIRNIIPATSHLNVIKYSNLISFLITNEILGSYRNIYWFGKPVRLFYVEISAALIFTIIFVTIFLFTFENAQLTNKVKNIKTIFNLKRTNKSTTVVKQEWYKLAIMNGALFTILLFTGFQVYNAYKAENYITAEEMFYSYYMKEITGPYDRDSYEFLNNEKEKFEPIYSARRMLEKGKISSEEYNMIMSANYALNMEYEVFQRVLNQVNSLKNSNGKQLLYDTGYIKLFDFTDVLDLKDYLFTALITSLTFAGLFCIEKSSGMLKVIKATPLGMEYTAKSKIKVSFITSCIITIISIAPRFWQIGIGYGFKGLFVPAKSIDMLYNVSKHIPVIALIVFMILVRLLVTFVMTMIVLCISQKSDNYISAAMFSLLILELPALLYYLGVDSSKWITLYPTFHFANFFMNDGLNIFSWIYLMFSVFIIYVTYTLLIDEYSVR